MKRRSPQDAGFATGPQLDAIGRARRCACWVRDAHAPSPELELWRFDTAGSVVAARLLALGRDGVGGFSDGGEDDDGIWLVRRTAGTSLAAWVRERGAVPWREAVGIATSIARAAATCERSSLFPGQLTSRTVRMRNGRVELRADRLVHGLVGADTSAARASANGSARWMAPEQGAGDDPDNATNRYAIGLMLYRMLAGEDAFGGRGMRLGMDDRAQRGAPPMPSNIAETLPPGLQSTCLGLLSPDVTERPRTATAIADELATFFAEPAALIAEIRPAETDTPAPTVETADPRPPMTVTRHILTTALPLTLGLAIAIAALIAIAPPAASSAVVRQRAPLASAESVDDCASCHPRQSAEWHRSVMAHSATSPLFQSLEILIQEQVGKDRFCPDGAGVLRKADANTACRSRGTGVALTGSGGEHWCVNCHAPGENLAAAMPAWDGQSPASSSRLPLRDLLPASSLEGISCAFCHQVRGPGRDTGNPSWISAATGRQFSSRPENVRGTLGIGNSGYLLDIAELLAGVGTPRTLVRGGAHRKPTPTAKSYLASSQFCGSCHDVRLFGTDAGTGEHFKRLRNAYSEWVDWSASEVRAGREPASCQDCHMSAYPGVCVPGENPGEGDRDLCPPGTAFSPRAPGQYPRGRAAIDSAVGRVSTHYFSGVDVPLSTELSPLAADDDTVDVAGIPLGARQRRDLLLSRTFAFGVSDPRVIGDRLEIPVVIENVGAGHKVPAGFSQERELWVQLTVRDARGDVVYEVGRVDRGDSDLPDKIFTRVTTRDDLVDRGGRPLGLFGADVVDGPDHPEWKRDGRLAGEQAFRGRGLLNLQNGFQRCVRCIGRVDGNGDCQPRAGQREHRAARYADGFYDIDTGRCSSNLRGDKALFEVFFPVGALDATRGVIKGPDAIIDTRSAPPNTPLRYTYELDTDGRRGPFTVEARLLFRAFPPFLIRAFADYEADQDAQGKRPSGPLVTYDMLDRLEIVELARAEVTVQ